MNYSYLTVFILCLCLIACVENSKQRKVSTKDNYFSICEVLKKQRAYLEKLRPKIYKTSRVGNQLQKDTVLITNWESEWKLYEEADISQAIFRSTYLVIEGENETIYKAQRAENPVKQLRLVRGDGQLKSLEITYIQKKGLYIHGREMYLYFSDTLLDAYKIAGFQHVAMGDTLTYTVEAKLLL